MVGNSLYVRVLACALLVALFHVVCAQDIFVYDSKLFINNQEFITIGVDYSPTPLGSNANPGQGLCSNRISPYGTWGNNCYDSDFFDGVPWYGLNAGVNGFQQIWQRDFPNIKAIGANTIRLYNANPTTYAASLTYTNIIPYPTGRDHNLFMQMCVEYGFKVIFPLILDNTLFAQDSEPVMHRFHRWQIDEVGYSSLLIWQLGNEQTWTWQKSMYTNATIMQRYNDYVDYIKRYTYSKWGRRIPVSMSIQNTYSEYDYLMQYTHVDIFGTNIFEAGGNGGQIQYDNTNTITKVAQGTTTKNGAQGYDGMATATCEWAKPWLVTEFGFTYSNGYHQDYPSGEINRYWNHLVSNLDSAGCIGGVYFELTDEPTNGGKDQGVYSVSAGSQGSNSSTGVNQLVPDAVTARNPQLSDITSGTYNNQPSNFNTNIYSMLGRSQTTYSPSLQDRCGSNYQQCPGNTIPVCNGNGRCDRTTGTCYCGTGWSGPACATPTCPGSPQCSGRGSCSTYVSPPECFCNPGYFGLSCQSTPSFGTCPGGCTNGNGVCNNQTWTCACWPGWTGLDCAVTDLHGLGSRTSSVAATSSASTSATFGVTTSTASTSGTYVAATTAAASTSASTTAVLASSTGSVLATTTTQSASTSATLAASSTSSVSTGNTFAASTTKAASTTVGVITSSSASVVVTSTGSTSATVSASSTGSTSAVASKASSTAHSTTTSTASMSNQLATSSASAAGAAVTAAYASSTTVGVTTSSTASAQLAVSTTSSTSKTAVSTSTVQASTSTASTASIASQAAADMSTSTISVATSSTSTSNAVATSSTSTVGVATTSSTSSAKSAVAATSSTSVATKLTSASTTTSSTDSTTSSIGSTTSSSTESTTSSTGSSTTSSTGTNSTTQATIGVVVTVGTTTSTTTASSASSSSSSSSSTGQTSTTSVTGSATVGTVGSSTSSPPQLWDVTITMVVPGNYLCLDLNDLSMVLHQIFKIFPSSEKAIPNVNNQTYFSVNATFLVANSSVFTNASKTLMTSTYIQNLISNCGPNIISASVATSVYVPPKFLSGDATLTAAPNLIFVVFVALLSLWLPTSFL